MVDTLANPKIETRGLIKEYGKRRVVNKVDVHVNAGEIVGLLGPNGAGKTTTFYMVVGLVPATEGRVFLNDDDLTISRCIVALASGLATCRKRHRSFVK